MYRVLFLLLVCSFGQLFAQSEDFSRVKIWLQDKSMQELSELPIAIDHGSLKKDVWYVTDLSDSELALVEAAGFQVDILIYDVQSFYLKRNAEGQTKSAKAQNCASETFTIPAVQNYSGGSMGGFYTYQEMLNNLDSMVAKYPHLISARAPIDTFTSIENRPIYWLRISNNPNSDDFSKPEILYTALHHAREPASMQQLIYYMWYILENYASNEELKYVVNNVEMYFVPCINPDGYLYNEQTDPNGGGMHRKNRRNIGTNNKGVDLNRNYSYQFGGPGTSSNPNSDVYRGTGAFSEPETRAMEWFTINHNFKITLNYHSYADALLFPWGYEDNFQCPDHDLYEALSGYLVSQNNYDNYQSALLYEAAGDSDDWAYGEQNDKPKVFAMTPEIGGNNDGFWPAQQDILGICRENVFQNYAAAKSLLDNYKLTESSPQFLSSTSFILDLSLQRLGLENENYLVNVSALDATVNNISNPPLITLASFGQFNPFFVDGDLDPASVQDNKVTFLVTINTDNYTYYDTIVKYFGDEEVVFEDNGLNLDGWQSGSSWGLDNDSYSAPTSTSDSPNGDYSNNESNELISNPINLQNSEIAFAEFYAKWEIEQGYDYVQISASLDGNSWTPLCGQYTVIGNDNQDENQPLYDGVQATWVKESIDLSPYLGETIQLRFSLESDQFSRGDGFKFDDFKVISFEGESTGLPSLSSTIFRYYPNPAKDQLTLELKSDEMASLELINLLGQTIKVLKLSKGMQTVSLEGISSGVYTILLKQQNKVIHVDKLILHE